MIAIPNMDKPKECKECQWHLDFYIEDEQVGGLCTITEKDDKENTCPLIEIVRCGECEYYIDNTCDCYSLYGDLSGDLIGVHFEPNEDHFCSYGERRE